MADGIRALHRELDRRTAKTAADAAIDQIPRSVSELLHRGIEYRVKKGLSARTAKDYRALADGPLQIAFGNMDWRDLTSTMIGDFLEASLTAGKTTTGNRARAVISIAYNYAIKRSWTSVNPCKGTEPNPPTGQLTDKHAARAAQFQTRYVPKEEFLVVYEKLPEWHQDVLLCAYLIGVRQGDLLFLRRDAIRDGAIYIKERKTSRGTRKAVKVLMSADVRQHVDRALARQTSIANRPLEVLRPRSGKLARRRKHWKESDYVFCNAENRPITQSALRTAMTRAGADFDFRDIRATVVTDDEAEKAEAMTITSGNLLGHDTQMLAVYQKHEVKRSESQGRGELPAVVGVKPRLRVIQGRSI